MQHYCPLHPQVVDVIQPFLDNTQYDEPMFRQLSFARWLRACSIPLAHGGQWFVPGDLRKFCEQQATYCSGISQIRTTYSRTGSVELIGDSTSIRCGSTCMTRICGSERRSVLVRETSPLRFTQLLYVISVLLYAFYNQTAHRSGHCKRSTNHDL